VKEFFLLSFYVLLACLFHSPFVSADGPKKKPEPVPEKQVEPKKKYIFIGKLLEKKKIEDKKRMKIRRTERITGKRGRRANEATCSSSRATI
jgi:hypothetical protein